MKRLVWVPITLTALLGCDFVPTQDTEPITATVSHSSTASAGDAVAYVVNETLDRVVVIDIATNTVITSVTVGDRPGDLDMTPDGSAVYVANRGTGDVSVISTSTNTVVATVGPLGTNPNSVAITPDGAFAYVSNFVSGDVSVIATATNTVVATVPVGAGAVGLAVTPDGARVYVTNNTDDTVSVISTATNTVVATIVVGDAPQDVAITTDGAFAYVSNFSSSNMTVIDVATNTVVTTVPLGGVGRSITMSPDGAFAYVAASSSVKTLETATHSIVSSVLVGSQPWGLAVTPDGDFVYASRYSSTDVSVISTASNTVVSLIGVGAPPNIGIVIGNIVTDNEGPITTVQTLSPIEVGASVELNATIDDTNTGGSNIASAGFTINGGGGPMAADDGAFDAPIEDVNVIATAPAEAGVYDACVNGTDEAANTGEEDCTLLVAYDPDGGFVTGGGWIWADTDDCPGCNSLGEGKANFGFVSKYKRGATKPSGQTEFQFHAGDLNFHSESYDWLVITQAGSNAQFKGTGTINGAGDFKFMLWATDGTPDSFRIRIWSEDGSGNETEYFDNGAQDPIGGGSIKIHTN